MRALLKIAAVMALACGAQAQAAEQSQPNIVLVLVDDLGFSDLGCYGGEIDTPVLDELAEAGLRFSRFTNSAKCTTSRQLH